MELTQNRGKEGIFKFKYYYLIASSKTIKALKIVCWPDKHISYIH